MSKRKTNAITTQVPRHFRGNFVYKSAFSAEVSDLIAQKIPDRNERMGAIQALITEYIERVGEKPEITELERLANAVLHEELTDRHSNKLRATEYPFMSEWQLSVRNEAEYSLNLADAIATDGRNHKPPVRRRRTAKELRFIDRNAQIRNAERRKQYRKDTEPGPVISYRVPIAEVR